MHYNVLIKFHTLHKMKSVHVLHIGIIVVAWHGMALKNATKVGSDESKVNFRSD